MYARVTRTWIGDALVAAAVGALMLFEVANEQLRPYAFSVPIFASFAVAYVWRRRAPLAVLAVGASGQLVNTAAGVSLHKPFSPMIIAFLVLYSVALYEPPRRSVPGLALMLASTFASIAIAQRNGESYGGTDYGFVGILFAVPWLVGLAIRARVRGGFRLILEGQDGIEFVGEAENGLEAVDRVRELRPDVTLMDVRMPELDGIEATRRIVTQGLPTRVLVLTTFDDDRVVYDALKAGAAGFLLKSAPPARLVEAVRLVAAGEELLAPTVTRRLIEQYVRRPPPGEAAPAELEELTDREREVLELIATGLSNGEIAARLYVSGATVKTHVNRVFSKLGLRDRVQAVVLAYESGLVRPGERS